MDALIKAIGVKLMKCPQFILFFIFGGNQVALSWISVSFYPFSNPFHFYLGKKLFHAPLWNWEQHISAAEQWIICACYCCIYFNRPIVWEFFNLLYFSVLWFVLIRTGPQWGNNKCFPSLPRIIEHSSICAYPSALHTPRVVSMLEFSSRCWWLPLKPFMARDQVDGPILSSCICPDLAREPCYKSHLLRVSSYRTQEQIFSHDNGCLEHPPASVE